MKTLPALPVCITGYSGSGKTSLLENLVPALARLEYTVGYFKSGAHRIDFDEEGKDTARLKSAGAWAVAIEGEGGRAHFPSRASMISASIFDHEMLPGKFEKDQCKRALAEHLSRCKLANLRPVFDECDVILIEGMKASPFPKILVNRSDNEKGILPQGELRNVVASFKWDSLPADFSETVEATISIISRLLNSHPRSNAEDLAGAVLCGGMGTRMGADKALFPLPGCTDNPDDVATPTWIERIYALMSHYVSEVWLSGRIVSLHDSVLPNIEIPVRCHLDSIPDAGPLGGIDTALRIASGKAALILPCDLPLISSRTLESLLEGRDRTADATAFKRSDGLLEPTVAIFEPTAGPQLDSFISSGNRAIHKFLGAIHTNWLPLPRELERDFTNVNTPKDLAEVLNPER